MLPNSIKMQPTPSRSKAPYPWLLKLSQSRSMQSSIFWCIRPIPIFYLYPITMLKYPISCQIRTINGRRSHTLPQILQNRTKTLPSNCSMAAAIPTVQKLDFVSTPSKSNPRASWCIAHALGPTTVPSDSLNGLEQRRGRFLQNQRRPWLFLQAFSFNCTFTP